MNNKVNRFVKKYSSNDRVLVDGQVWTICKDNYSDNSKHIYYKVSRGSWKKYIRGDLLKSV